MELIPIIKASLGIFTILTSITLAVSYVIYKIKDRNRVKPYDKKTEIQEPVKVIELPQRNKLNGKFRVINEQEPVPVKIPAEPEFRKIAAPSNEMQNYYAASPRKNSENEVFNIYNLYSNSDVRPMHKLKLGGLAAE